MNPLQRLARRRAHLDRKNLLRSLTEVIDRIPDGINLGQGVCDLDPPAPLVRGAVASIEGADRQTYTPYSGVPELRSAIAHKLTTFNEIPCSADEIVVTLGSSGAFYAAVLTLCEPGDEVVLFEPFYSYHHTALALCDVKPVCVGLTGPDYALDVEALRAALGARTRAVVINTPANPSGKVFSRDELEAIATALDSAASDAIVITDEVYEYMLYDGRRHVSPATVDGLAQRTLTISSFSKTYSITGWRVGYVQGPAATVDAIGRVCDQIHVCAPRPMQRGVERALRELPPGYYDDLQAGYEVRRNRFCDALEAAGFAITRPQGAYYVLADYRPVLGDLEPEPAAFALIERVGINGVPGDLFYGDPAAVRSIRFHFAVEADVLAEACRRLEGIAG